jgi:hypothetical protein
MRNLVIGIIEIYYNRVPRHSANGWVTPVEFERLYNQNLEYGYTGDAQSCAPEFDIKLAKCMICIDRGLQIATTRGSIALSWSAF